MSETAEWEARSACQGVNTEQFYTVDDFTHPHLDGAERKAINQARQRRAKRVCRACPVVNECLTLALREQISHGIFGGLTPDERSSVKVVSRVA